MATEYGFKAGLKKSEIKPERTHGRLALLYNPRTQAGVDRLGQSVLVWRWLRGGNPRVECKGIGRNSVSPCAKLSRDFRLPLPW